MLPLGLLTRAWLRFMEGDPEGAKADLDDAWQIAERGAMKLHMADIHLHRARLFRDRAALEPPPPDSSRRRAITAATGSSPMPARR